MVAVVVSLFVLAALLGGLYVRRNRPLPGAGAADGGLDVPAVEAWAEADVPEVRVVNRSPHPVHDVQAYVALGRRRPKCVGWIRTLPPTGDEAAKVALTADGRESWQRWQGTQRSGDVAVEVVFRDEAGRQWRRDRRGALAAVDG